MFRFHALAAAAVLAASVPSLAHAGPETTFTYQGSLSDAGTPADGIFDLSFSLWTALSGGSKVGPTLTVNSQSVVNGVFSCELDFGASSFDGSPRWLQIVVDSQTLSPRQPITRAPYSIATRGIVVDANNNVGLGVATPQYPLHIEAPGGQVFTMYARNNNASGVGVYGQSDQPGGNGVIGYSPAATGGGNGVFGQTSSTNGRGVFGFATAATGVNFGLRGLTNSNAGRGVFGQANSTTGETFGVFGQSDSTGGRGVFGLASSASGASYGVYGRTNSTGGRGVFGESTAASGESYGVLGTSLSPLGMGVVGQALSATGPVSGVFGRSDSNAGRGVIGQSTAATGVNYGVYGTATSTQGRGVFGSAEATTGSTVGTTGQAYSTAGIGVLGSAFATSGSPIGVFGNANFAGGYDFFAGGAGINYGSPSSIRWKRNIAAIESPLEKLAQIRGVTYDWDEAHGGNHDIGFIGEEVGKVVPEIVAYEEGGEYVTGMDYGRMTPLLVEAVNTLRAEKDAQIAELRETNNALRARLEALEAAVEAMQDRD